MFDLQAIMIVINHEFGEENYSVIHVWNNLIISMFLQNQQAPQKVSKVLSGQFVLWNIENQT